MVATCSVVGCHNRWSSNDPGRSFHSFPKDPKVLKRWLRKIRRDRDGKLWYPNKFDRICSDHFHVEDFSDVVSCLPRLRRDAVPSIFPEVYYQPNKKRQIIKKGAGCHHDGNDQAIDGCGDDDDDDDNDIPPEHHYQTISDMSDANSSQNKVKTFHTMERCEQILRLVKPFRERDVMILVEKYLKLCEKFQRLKRLASINVDLLYLGMDLGNLPGIKEEVSKIQQLVHLVMNETEVYDIEIFSTENEVVAEHDGVFEQHVISEVKKDDSIEEYGNKDNASQENEVYHGTVTDHLSEDNGRLEWEIAVSTTLSDFTKKNVNDACMREEGLLDCTAKGKKAQLALDCPSSTQCSEGFLNIGTKEINIMNGNTPCIQVEKKETNNDMETESSCVVNNSVEHNNPISICNDDVDETESFDLSHADASGNNDEDLHFGKLKNRMELDQFLASHNDGDIHFCKFCDKRFKSMISLKNHLLKFLEKRVFICSLCGKEFQKRYRLMQHRVTHDENKEKKRFKCLECDKEFLYKHDLSCHKEIVHLNGHKSQLCFVCGVTIKGKRGLLKHVKQHEEFKKNGFQRCLTCGKDFVTKKLLDVHMKYHFGPKHVERHKACPICGRNIKSHNLNRHIRTHKGEKPYKCSICDKTFAEKYTLKEHQYIHFELYPHRCKYCRKGFETAALLSLHKQAYPNNCCKKSYRRPRVDPATKQRVKSTRCTCCKKHFSSSISFALHLLKSHTIELNHCLLCNDGVTFPSSEDFELHLKNVHLTKKPFNCNICDESFYTSYRYYNHKLLHKDKNALICKHCRKSFSSELSLRNHIETTHSHQAKTYNCHICGKQFNRKANHLLHVARHSGLKPYKCRVCGAMLGSRDSLKLHFWTHSETKRFPCDKCDKGFNDKRNYLSHIKKYHLS